MKISEFKDNTQIEGEYLVKSRELKTSTGGGAYLDLTLMDSSGEINSKIWDASESLLDIFEPKTVLKIRGLVNTWKSKKQLKIREYRIIPAGEYDISEFLQCAPVEKNEMFSYIYDTIISFKNEDLKAITLAIVDEYKKDFLCYPAARNNHHNIIGGLLYHVYRMLKTAKVLKTVYPKIKLELLQSGIILHDICKTKEMQLDSLGFVKEYTVDGNMLGHITMGVCLIDRYSDKLKIDKELTMLLKHMILSHHGHMEFGSPVLPMFLEAELLHMIDNIDASLFEFERNAESIEPGELSLPVYGLDKRRVYRSFFECE